MRPTFQDDDAAQYKAFQERIKRIEDAIAPEVVHFVGDAGEPAYQNSWVILSAGRGAYFYRHNGHTYLGGYAKNGTVGSAMFTLPARFCPVFIEEWPVSANGAFGAVSVSTAGAVILFTGSNSYVCLSTINFRHA